jgi:secreted PhoX family phosphatase
MKHNSSPPFKEILEKHLSRREFIHQSLKGLVAAAAISSLGKTAFAEKKRLSETTSISSFSFTEIAKNTSATHTVPDGFDVQVLLRWGDPLFPESPAFDFKRQTPASQEKQFGASCDFTALLPVKDPNRRLLWVNHEYADTIRMFPNITNAKQKNAEHVRIEMASVGGSICEIKRKDGVFKPIITSSYNRRITANTPMRISGAAAGNPRMQTSYDKSGTRVLGTLANCSGGVTPWGTLLTCEENFDDYFSGADQSEHSEKNNYSRYGLDANYPTNWHLADNRFDVSKEPHEPNRFGWVVEIDPYDPHSLPVKRTALGRFKHETATVTFASPSDKRIVIYSGDDEKFEYLYRFVSTHAYDEKNPKANRDLLDDGILYAARFDEFAECTWLPLVYGTEPLTKKNGFYSQGDVLIETRRAADLLGATPMDRPEGITVDKNGDVYIALTKNSDRDEKAINPANPRANNTHGHIIKLSSNDASGSMARASCNWDIFMLAGNPADKKDGAHYHHAPSKNGWLSCPDNIVISADGALWIATDGQPKSIGFNDALYRCELRGDHAGAPKLFFTAPRGAEVTGISFVPLGESLFLSVQHPAEVDGSTADAPTTRWPDFDVNLPPRSSVVVISRAVKI